MASQKKLLKGVAEHLDQDEQILTHVYGAYETKRFGKDSARNGIFVATDNRLVFYAKKLGGYELESFPYKNISSFEQGKGLMGHTFKFFASGNEAKVKWINKGDIDGFTRLVKSKMGGQRSAEGRGGAPAAPLTDPVEQLRRYAGLRDDGIITEEEFEEKKRQLLSE